MLHSIALLAGVGLAPPALAADDPNEDDSAADEEQGEATGWRDVVVEDGGPTRMEDKRDYRNLVTVGFGFLPSTVKGTYRRLLSDRFSVMAGAGIGAASWDIDGDERAFRRVLGVAGADVHPIGNGLHGFYVGPRVRFAQWSVSGGGDHYNTSTVSIRAVLLGWRWVWDPGLSLALGLGGQYRIRTSDSSIWDDLPVQSEGFGSFMEFQLGWAF